ncbi:hypothetical protein TNCV_96711 [Trichonephila clavipes]|nr:hypothetical protein TNCV_96711 [Trichonephila clavipes]
MPFCTPFATHLMPSSDPVQMSTLCGDLGRPSWRHYHLFGIDSTTGRLLSAQPLSHLLLRQANFKHANGFSSQDII